MNTNLKKKRYISVHIWNDWQACVEMDEVCDFTDNCGDSTDEENCGEFTMTNFEVLDDDDDGDDDDGNGDDGNGNDDDEWRL